MPESLSANPGKQPERSVVIHSYSPVFYWWPLWIVGLVLGVATFLSGDRAVWLDNPDTTGPEQNRC